MTAVRMRESLRYAARLFASLVAVTALGGALVGVGLALGWPGVLGSRQIASVLGSTSGGVAYTAAGAVVLLVGIGVLAIGYLAAGYKLVADAVAAGTGAGATAAGEAEAAAQARSVPGLDESPDPSDPPEEGGEATSATASGSDDPADTVATASPNSSPGDVGEAESPPSGTAAESAGVDASAESEPPEMSPEEIAFGSSSATDESREPGDDASVEGDSFDGVDDEGFEDEEFDDEFDEEESDDGFEDDEFDDDEFDDEPVESADDGTNVRPAGGSASSDPLGDPTEDD